MIDNVFLRQLHDRPWLLADGATGTNMFEKGLPVGGAPELWNDENPDAVRELHREFIEAGSDLILTNSFGGTRHRLKLHQSEDRVHELNVKAASLARAEADASGRTIIVAGSMGPTGELIQPLGSLTYEQAVEAFAEQASALAEGGVDVLWPETLSATDEVRAAIEGGARTGLPVVPNLSFDTNGSTMMGVSPVGMAEFCEGLDPRPPAYGTNCGVGASEVVAALLKVSRKQIAQSALVAKANCGIPEFVDGAIQYSGTPELMANYALLARGAGARIIGGCCGTTPVHVRHMREALESVVTIDAPTVEAIEQALGPLSEGGRNFDDSVAKVVRPARSRRGRRSQ